MVVSKEEETLQIIIDGQKINMTQSMKYLRAMLSSTRNMDVNINNRISKSTSRMFNAMKHVFLSKREVSKKVKIKI